VKQRATALSQAGWVMLLLVLLTEQSQAEQQKTSPVAALKTMPLETVPLESVPFKTVAPKRMSLKTIVQEVVTPRFVARELVGWVLTERVLIKPVFAERKTNQQIAPRPGIKGDLHRLFAARHLSVVLGSDKISRYRAGHIVDRRSYDWSVEGLGISIQKHF